MSRLHTIDLHYLGIPQAIAAFVMMGSDGPVLIETGPASTLNNLADGLASLNLGLADIRHALVTHIHLDHAGAAGHLARNGTRIYVHEFGAKHLIDPSRLIESATRIYADQMDRLWGSIVPVPEKLVTPVHDGDVIAIGDLRFTALETPGHARHHHAFAVDLVPPLPLGEGSEVRAERATGTQPGGATEPRTPSPRPSPRGRGSRRICFAGDAAGIIIPGIPEPPAGKFIAVPTPPPEFDPPAWKASIDRLSAMNFDAIHLTHFGVRRNVAEHLARLRELVDQHVDFVQHAMERREPREEMLARYIAWNRNAANSEGLSDEDAAKYVSANLLTMNVDGMIRWWSKNHHASAAPGA